MKSFILWTLCILTCGLSMYALNVQEWAIAAGFGVVSLACLWAAPTHGSNGLSFRP